MRSVKRLVVLACIAVLGATGSAWPTWDVPPKPIPPERAIPTLETSLQLLAEQVQASPGRAGELALSLGVEMVAGRITVVVEGTGFAHGQVAALGGEIAYAAEIFGLWEVAIPPSQLPALAQLPGVRFVRRPHQPIPAAIVSEGVSRTRAPNWHAGGFLGQGVRVAVIDIDFAGLSAAIAAGELKRVVFRRDYTGTGMEGDSVHGTACAEIVQDMAPQAELILMKVGNDVQLAAAVADAVALGARVISQSLAWFNTNFYDGTGVICDIVRSATERGVLWVNAAGNSAAPGASHWEGDWSDPDGDGWLNFYGADEVNHFTLEAGGEMKLWLTWDDWPLSSQDYDLYITDAAGNLIPGAGSWNEQSGTQPPTEFIYFRAPTSGRYGIAIHAYSAPRRPRLEIFGFPWGASFEYSPSRSSIPAPGNASFVLTVGAIGWRNWTAGPQQPYSSQGPTNSSRLNPVSITKPDISGPDEVSTMGYGREGYPGTSAAAPHVAGAAAVVWSANPGWTASQVRAWLEGNAVDMGTHGKDNLFGFGRLDLPAPVAPYHEDFEDVTGWTGSGLWHVRRSPCFVACGRLQGNYAHYARPGTCSYDTGRRTTGILTSPVIPVPSNTLLVLQFDFARIVESFLRATRDRTTVQLRIGRGAWRTIWTRTSRDPSPECGTFVFGFNTARNTQIQVRFVFDSVNSLHNAHPGWAVDNVLVMRQEQLVAGLAVATAFLEDLDADFAEGPLFLVYNSPNPVTSGRSTTFTVQGVEAERMRIEIYDLSGQSVYTGEASGNQLIWHTEDSAGRPVANGVYLYLAHVKVDGEWWISEVQKLLILR